VLTACSANVMSICAVAFANCATALAASPISVQESSCATAGVQLRDRS
jgi:hypothetical protein